MKHKGRTAKDNGLRDRLELRMLELGINQAEVVRRSGLTQATISHIQNKRILSLEASLLFRLADALECNARWLATGEGERSE